MTWLYKEREESTLLFLDWEEIKIEEEGMNLNS